MRSMVPPARRIQIVDDSRFRDHVAPPGHPEHEARLQAVGEILAEYAERTESASPREASDEELLRVHSGAHLRHVEQAAQRAPAQLDPDTYVSSASFEVARLAAGSCVDLALRIAGGKADAGFAASRPPGHHAESTHAMGFCLFNNVAIAARALQAEAGMDKILILDWDVHHGNGTQHSFDDDPSIFYASTHQFPFYPGTGAANEVGSGRGEGATFNIPLPAGCGDFEYIGVFQHLLVPVVREFRPDMILVSCGFDAHASDPLASMSLSGAGYLEMACIIRTLADELCEGRLCMVLEGGYAEQGLREGTSAVLDALLESDRSRIGPTPELQQGSSLRQIVREVSAVHRGRYSNLPDLA